MNVNHYIDINACNTWERFVVKNGLIMEIVIYYQ